MPGYLVPAQSASNPFTPTTLIASTTVNDAINELSRKTVNVFANASARSASITSPTNGMISYLTDVNAIQTYNGTAWVESSGGINPLLLAGN
jgi:hypothetical protein